MTQWPPKAPLIAITLRYISRKGFPCQKNPLFEKKTDNALRQKTIKKWWPTLVYANGMASVKKNYFWKVCSSSCYNPLTYYSYGVIYKPCGDRGEREGYIDIHWGHPKIIWREIEIITWLLFSRIVHKLRRGQKCPKMINNPHGLWMAPYAMQDDPSYFSFSFFEISAKWICSCFIFQMK